MASKSCMSAGCPWADRGWKGWSSCSNSAINSFLQTLTGNNVNCLANAPREPVGGPVCGDFIKSGTEQCDHGPSGSPSCDRSCRTKAGAACSSGTCCNTGTGAFKAAGTVCLAASNDCVLATTCTG
jgi:hypothetical protein